MRGGSRQREGKPSGRRTRQGVLHWGHAMSTTLITNGIVVDAGTMRPLDILISGERVESLLPRGSEVRADRVIDASGRYVLPGIIDAHNHPSMQTASIACRGRPCPAASPPSSPLHRGVAAWGKQGGLVQAIDDFIRKGKPVPASTSGCTAPLTANVMEEADEAIPELVARGSFPSRRSHPTENGA